MRVCLHHPGEPRAAILALVALLVLVAGPGCSHKVMAPQRAAIVDPALEASKAKPAPAALVVLGYNDLGMHCLNQDFSEFMILPPYNTLHAQVIDRTGERARIVTEGVTVRYCVPGNTCSATKTNFWDHVESLLGTSLPIDMGLSGNGLSGTMNPTGNGDWSVTGIPLTPLNDAMQTNTFQLGEVTVSSPELGTVRAQPVVPVSWELRCDLCHHGAPDAPKSILQAHDLLHGTALYDATTGGPAGGKPILCGSCHAQPELGLAGAAGVSNLSLAMHRAHAGRMMDVVSVVPGKVVCYACHPGLQTQCLRDVHVRSKMNCYHCHGAGTRDPMTAMLAVAAPAREPWLTEPRCGDCHHIPGHDYEQPGTLFRNSKGHGGLFCEACHNSTHAITPAQDAADNVQSIALQNYAGAIQKCTVCHREQPRAPFAHRYVRTPPS